MLLYLKGILIGIGKIIPGVSGAFIAINLNLYEPLINALTNFGTNPRKNFIFLLKVSLGILTSIVLLSNLILYFLTNHYFITMSLFIGLLLGGTYHYIKTINLNKLNLSIIFVIALLAFLISIANNSNNYILKNNFIDNIIFFIGGIIEITSSIIPGISATSLLMTIGIYHEVLRMIANIYNYHFLFAHLNLYLSYAIGMIIFFIVNIFLIKYLITKHKSIFNTLIVALSISSLIFLCVTTMTSTFDIFALILGIMMFVTGLLLSFILK